ncbi:MAG: hypothetical protein PUA81_04470 [Oscillospiraceae bacterium]|nr:hypothetical protein [Oscillospiraceae bacterium]
MDLFIFIVCLAVSAINTYIAFSAVSGNQPRFISEKRKTIMNWFYLSVSLLVIAFLLDASKLVSLGSCGGLTGACAVFGVLSALAVIISGKEVKRRSLLKLAVRSLMVCGLAEMFVFNFNCTHLFGKNYQKGRFDLGSAISENYNAETGTNLTSGEFFLEYDAIDIPIGTLTFDAESNVRGYVDVSIDMTDDTNTASYRFDIANGRIIDGNRKSMTIPCNFSGAVHKIRFRFSAKDGETITIKSISANEPINFRFSIMRFGIIYGICLLFWLMTSSKQFSKSFGENSDLTVRLANLLTVLLIAAALWLTNAGRYEYTEHNFAADFKSTSGNQITQELVDAFIDGRVTMSTQMNQELLALDNPYDWSQRNTLDSYVPWDHLLYDGEYYSYYGIGPVLTLFLPYKLITGYYFPSCWAVFLFGCIGILFLTKLYLCFMEKFFRKTRSSLIIMGLFIIQMITGVWFCFNVPNFYEIAQTSGFACVTSGAYFMLSSNVIGDGKIKKGRLAASAALLSLGVLCRPTLAVYCVAALLFIYAGFAKLKRSGEKKKVGYVSYFACALLPFAIIGSVQMIYNYMRFGSFFDFGIQYSLTINDFTKSQYHTHFVMIGLFNYLFAMPSFIQDFPFFSMSYVPTFNPQGYYFVATVSSLGILWKALPVLSYGFGIKAYRLSKNENKRLYTLLLIAVCIACPFAVIFSIWESGYGARYCVDFAWQIFIGALVIAFIMYGKLCDSLKKHLCRAMAVSALISLVLCFAQIYNWIDPLTLSADYQSDCLSFARLFEFWR